MPSQPKKPFVLIPGVTYFHVPNLPPKVWTIVKKWRSRKLTGRQVVILALFHLDELNEEKAEELSKRVAEMYPEHRVDTKVEWGWK